MDMRGEVTPGDGKLCAVVIRKDGTREELGELKPSFWQRIGWILTFQFFLLGWSMLLISHHIGFPLFIIGLVTNAAAAYEAAEFAGGASPISNFKFHDCGTGTTAAAVTDTALVTPAGTARVSGTGSSASNVFTSVATISFTASLAITEWGLFSATTAGTLLDRRVFAAINVASGDSIQFTYNLTIPSGGT